jgi:subtilisin family serine protease
MFAGRIAAFRRSLAVLESELRVWHYRSKCSFNDSYSKGHVMLSEFANRQVRGHGHFASNLREIRKLRRGRRIRRLGLERLEQRQLLAANVMGPGIDPGSLVLDTSAYHPSRILIQLADEQPANDVLPSLDLGEPLGTGQRLHRVDLGYDLNVVDALELYSKLPNVVYAQPDYRVSISGTPNDPRFGELWALNNTGQAGGTPDADIDALEAWDITTGSDDVVIAVIDTGIDYTHPDLVNNLWVNLAEEGGAAGVDDDGNGYIDDVYGYDFVNNDSDPWDDHSHGTHVSGTIAAVGNNDEGVTGINWQASVMALKFLDATGYGYNSDAIEAINYASANGARIINASWGDSNNDLAVKATIESFPGLFVAAAGNSGFDLDSTSWIGQLLFNFYPAEFDSSNIISVAATDRNDQLASWSNYGAVSVDLGAPGVSILSTMPGGGYGLKEGTSMAAPHVAGVAGLVLSQDPSMTTAELKQRILDSVDPLPVLSGKTVTGGRLNALNAVSSMNRPPIAVDDAPAAFDEDASVTIDVLANDTDPDGDVLAVSWAADGDHGTVVINADERLTYIPDADYFGTDSFAYGISDGHGGVSTAIVSIRINPVNDAPEAHDQSVGVKQGSSKDITLVATDVDGDALTYVVAEGGGPYHGTLTGEAPHMTYTPDADFSGEDSFQFFANDGIVSSEHAVVSLSVAANNVPVADDQSARTLEDSSKAITLSGSDPDGDSITYVLVDLPGHGSLSGSVPNLIYTPDDDYHGSDNFTFRVNDGIDDSEIATVSITIDPVNDAPVADPQTVSTNEDTPKGITLTGSDVDGDLLSYVVTTGPAYGVLTGDAPSLVYTPTGDFYGADSFTFKVNDGITDSVTATVTIDVRPVNDAPTAVVESSSTYRDSAVIVDVLANDIDPEDDPLQIIVTGHANGVAVVDDHGTSADLSDDTVLFTPAAGFVGKASFTYKVNDGQLDSNVVTVNIDVLESASGPNLIHGVIDGVGSDDWTLVSLEQSYTEMVVVATPNYDSLSAPGVTRIRNADGSSFEVRVDPAGGAALSGVSVHYVVVEAGVYEETGFKMEAVRFTSTRTDENNSWVGEARSYQQFYANPVVIGQVMTYNDSAWSVFWASGSNRSAPPSSSAFKVGKHVGEDSVVTREHEDIGYLVFETSVTGTAEIEGLPYIAAVGADSIKGVGDAPAYTYSYEAMANSKTAVVSQAGMDGGNGGWAVLYGSAPITPTGSTLKLAVDEDQNKDSERRHTSEQVAYLIIDPPLDQPVSAVDSNAFSLLGLVTEPEQSFSDVLTETTTCRYQKQPQPANEIHDVGWTDPMALPARRIELLASPIQVLDEFFAKLDAECELFDEVVRLSPLH